MTYEEAKELMAGLYKIPVVDDLGVEVYAQSVNEAIDLAIRCLEERAYCEGVKCGVKNMCIKCRKERNET